MIYHKIIHLDKRIIRKALIFNGRTNERDKIIEFGFTNELVAKQIIKIYENIINK